MSLEEVERTLVAGIDPLAAPSVAYGVARGDETLLLGAAGLADKAGGVVATTRTPYSLASVTKPMTATAVMMLAGHDLDAPIDAPLEGRAGDPREATVRRVLNHTAGLPLHYRFYYADEGIARTPFDETVRRYGKLFSPPGARHHYSNLGYGLLDDLVARVSGVPYATFMAERVFAPLGMENTAIDAPPGAAVAYGPDGVAYPRYDTDHPGGSAAFASVEDLLAFGRFHLGRGPALLTTASRKAMQEPTLGYGLGWGVSDRFGLRIVGHTGGMGGVRTILRLVPELDIVVAILVNGEDDRVFGLADDAIAALDEGFRQGLEAERARPSPEKAVSPVPPEAWGLWQGTVLTHEDELPFALEVRSGTEVLARLDGEEGFAEGLRVADGRLLGVFDGDVGTADAVRPYHLHLDLALGETLRGATVAITRVESTGGAPGHRLGNALSHWTELRR